MPRDRLVYQLVPCSLNTHEPSIVRNYVKWLTETWVSCWGEASASYGCSLMFVFEGCWYLSKLEAVLAAAAGAGASYEVFV